MGTYSASGQTQQRQAWLDMISISEGTYGRGDNGYNVLVNPGGLFDNGYVDHPRIYVPAANSTAAGRYQILAKTWDGIKTVIGASDFSPANQDAAAIALTRRRGALADVDAGNIASAITKCNREWASFAGSPYNQHPHDMGTMLAWFQAQGGAIA
ncbi:glycoside hydrolase family 104 protein [Burkholderia sp. Tr-20390]|nr:glycoside hydrolase family 104 protein [Burkholderia sp. Tr-20390]